MKRYLHSCEDPMAAAHSIVLSRHCTVIKSLYSPRCAEEYCECVSVVKKPWVRTCVFTTGLAIKMAHTKASADNSLALSTQTKYEMHRKTTVWIPATYAQVYNVLCGKSHTAIVHHLHSNFLKQKKPLQCIQTSKLMKQKKTDAFPTHSQRQWTAREEFSTLTERR